MHLSKSSRINDTVIVKRDSVFLHGLGIFINFTQEYIIMYFMGFDNYFVEGYIPPFEL